MNIIKFELKRYLTFIIVWSITIVLISALFVSFYPMLKGDLSSFAKIMENYPEIIKKMFGFNADLLTSSLGYYSSFAFAFILLFASISASILGFTILSGDVFKKSAEFLYTKPVTRQKIVVSKITASVLLLIIFNVIVLIFNYLILAITGPINIYLYFLVTSVLFFVQVSFFSISLLISLFMKIKSPIASGLAVTFMFYIGGVALSNDFRVLIPFKYFDMLNVISNKEYEVEYLILILFIFIISIISSIFVFEKKDL